MVEECPIDPDWLSQAVSIARGAGGILLDRFNKARAQGGAVPRFKSTAIDPVTEFDLASEDYIVAELRRQFPDHRVIGEEGGPYASAATSAESPWAWQIDPLDGTVNFSHGLALFCVSMGLLLNGRPVLGVVFNPATDELFAATQGGGASLNDRPLRVSTTANLDRALLVTGFAYDTHDSDSNMRNFLGFQHSCQATRRIGSTALNLCYTAAGYMDGYWELKTQAHDIAAGVILVREAGGLVTDFDGGDDMFVSHRIVASNGLLHQAMLTVLGEANDRD